MGKKSTVNLLVDVNYESNVKNHMNYANVVQICIIK